MDIDARVDAFCTKMKRLQIDGAFLSAKRTLELMRDLLTTQRHADEVALIDHVKAVATKLISAKPQELAVGNMVRRVLHLIREVAGQSTGAGAEEEEYKQSNRGAGLITLLDKPAGSTHAPEGGSNRGHRESDVGADTTGTEEEQRHARKAAKNRQWAGKAQVIELVNELIDEMDLADEAITEKATEHIHANEVILTFGLSQTTLKFLIRAAERRKFQVVVAEGAPTLRGLTMAKHLMDAGIATMVIPDSCIFAMMARVNKVLVGAQAVLATGGILGQTGTRSVALAAKHHSIPFVVITGLYKLSPLFPHDPQVMFNDFKSPAAFADRKLMGCALNVGPDGRYTEGLLKLPCPSVDYVSPEFIDLLITDTGGYTPLYIYRLLSEYYTREDYVLSKDLLNKMTGH